MPEDPIKDDLSSQWPKEVRQAYESLKIPSLYDCVLANEKLSWEIRKQNRDVKMMAENMGKIVVQFDSLLTTISEEWEEYEDEEGETTLQAFTGEPREELTDLEYDLLSDRQAYLKKQSQDILIEIADSIFDLSHASKQTSHQLLSLLPKKEGLFPHLPNWHPLAEDLIQSLLEHINHVRYRLLGRLEEMRIHLIDPHPGESFDSEKHQVLEQVAGGEKGTIAQTIRVGYIQDNEVLRLAAVLLFV
jgi:molecular chaperone GrpE (heat shock protein)